VSPCLRAFWEERARPAGVVGPRDLEPLMRADWDLDGMGEG